MGHSITAAVIGTTGLTGIITAFLANQRRERTIAAEAKAAADAKAGEAKKNAATIVP